MASPTATSPPTESKQSESVSHLSADILPVSDSSPTGDPSPPQPQQLQQNNSSLLQLAYNALGATGRGALRVIDAVGGELALVFGITVPKYDYVLYAYQDEQSKLKEEEGKYLGDEEMAVKESSQDSVEEKSFVQERISNCDSNDSDEDGAKPSNTTESQHQTTVSTTPQTS